MINKSQVKNHIIIDTPGRATARHVSTPLVIFNLLAAIQVVYETFEVGGEKLLLEVPGKSFLLARAWQPRP